MAHQQQFLEELQRRYPEGNARLEAEIRNIQAAFNRTANVENLANTRNAIQKDKYTCNYCGKKYHLRSSYTRHKLSHERNLECRICRRHFTRKDKFNLHLKRCGQQMFARNHNFHCQHCGNVYNNYASLFQHVTERHPLNQTGSGVDEQVTQKSTNADSPLSSSVPSAAVNATQDSAINGHVRKFTIHPQQGEKNDMLSFFSHAKPKVIRLLQSTTPAHNQGIKYYLCVEVVMYRENMDGNSEEATAHFRSNVHVHFPSEPISEHDINECFQKMFQSFENYCRNGSAWLIKHIVKLDIMCVSYLPLRGSTYIPLPLTLKRSQSLINVKNNDQKCFVWSVLCGLHSEEFEQQDSVENYLQYEHELDMNSIEFPMQIIDINRFEQQNPDISINVFGFESEIFPMRITKERQRCHHINLLYMSRDNTTHFCFIKDLDRFLSRTKRYNGRQYWCVYCLNAFGSEMLLEQHHSQCSSNEPQKIIMPEDGNNILKFTEFEKTMTLDFILYSDFESLNVKMATCASNPAHSSTTNETVQEPCCFAYKRVCTDPRYTKPTVVYQGPNVVSTFIECLQEEEKEIQEILSCEVPIIMTQTDIENFENATHCFICEKPFKPWDVRVRDHSHLTGKYRGCAHNECNLKCQRQKFIPVVFHNLRGYDGHILCQSIGKFKEEKLNCIPNNMEKYISFSLGNLRFIDSLQFLNSSLETLVENLKKEGLVHFSLFQEEFPNPKHQELLLRKGVFFYEYLDSLERFEETELPPIEAFYSKLTQETVSLEDYEHACKVFDTLGCENLLDYTLLYVQVDVLLLSCIYERFRQVCMNYYRLDPAWFYTAPGLSWSAMLLHTGVEIELMTDINQLLFAERAIRGGLSYINKRHTKAHNCYLPDYDITQPSNFILYLDANNLYSKAMLQPLPVGDYRFLEPEEIEKFDITSVLLHTNKGYLLEVDLHYPHHLHDYFKDYPLAPEKRTITDEELSPYAKQLWEKLNSKNAKRAKVPKLVATLLNKEKYVCDIRNLCLYLELGMELKGIHQILEFRQDDFLKRYIDFNTQKRQEAKNDFEKDFFKLLCCACFGKTMENLRKRRNIKLVSQERKLNKLTAKPSFKGCRIFNQDLVGVENVPTSIKMSRPVIIGAVILDLAKAHMYEFYYKHLKAKYQEEITLLMTDTDSLVCEISTDNIYQDLHDNLEEFYDTSNYPKEHFLNSERNKKVVGKFKDEQGGQPISEFCGLRSKQYSLKVGDQEIKRNKGISKTVIRKDLTHQMYLDALFKEDISKASMNLIRSQDHILYMQKIKKTALSAFDDKVFLLNDGINSLPYGHYRCMDYVS